MPNATVPSDRRGWTCMRGVRRLSPHLPVLTSFTCSVAADWAPHLAFSLPLSGMFLLQVSASLPVSVHSGLYSVRSPQTALTLCSPSTLLIPLFLSVHTILKNRFFPCLSYLLAPSSSDYEPRGRDVGLFCTLLDSQCLEIVPGRRFQCIYVD